MADGLWSKVMRWFGLGGTPEAPADDARPRFRPRSRFDAAQTNDSNKNHWSNADGLSAAAANSLDVRRTLRNRSRYERDNNGYMGGMARSLAYDHVGTGPTLQVLSENDDANSLIEKRFGDWAKQVRLSEKLWLMRQARAVDGEAFAILSTNPGLPGPVQLDVRPVEADKITDPNLTLMPVRSQTGMADGIEYDRWGNPVSYVVLREHPGDLYRIWPADFDRIPARNMIHWFRKDRPEQLRGIPEFATALPICSVQRRWTGATLAAAETAADFAAVLQTEAPGDEGDTPEPWDSIPIDKGTMTTLPSGAKLGQFKAEHPTTTYPAFKREIIAESARTVGMPVNVATADSSQHNFSSAKLDHFGYRGGLQVERSWDNWNVLEKIYLAWLEEASLIPGHLPAGVDVASLPRKWNWTGWPSMDKDEAKNDTERLMNGSTNLAELYADWGQDWRVMVAQRGREVEMLRKLNIPLPGETAQASSDAGTTKDNGDPQAKPAQPMPRRRPQPDDAESVAYRNGRH